MVGEWGSAAEETAAAQIAAYNLSDPSGFFENVTAAPGLAERVILSPHVYGPNITVRYLSYLPCQIGAAEADDCKRKQRRQPGPLAKLFIVSCSHVSACATNVRRPARKGSVAPAAAMCARTPDCCFFALRCKSAHPIFHMSCRGGLAALMAATSSACCSYPSGTCLPPALWPPMAQPPASQSSSASSARPWTRVRCAHCRDLSGRPMTKCAQKWHTPVSRQQGGLALGLSESACHDQPKRACSYHVMRCNCCSTHLTSCLTVSM